MVRNVGMESSVVHSALGKGLGTTRVVMGAHSMNVLQWQKKNHHMVLHIDSHMDNAQCVMK